MKKITLLTLFGLFFTWIGTSQVIIGPQDGTTSNIPIYGCFEFSYTQQIVYQSEINAGGNITSVSFYYDSGPTTNSTDWTIYLGHTAKTEFTSDTDWEASANLTQVYSGTVTFPAAGNQMVINFSTPFAYNNTDNLIIAVDENQLGFSCSPNFGKTGSFGAQRSIYYRSDTVNPDPASPPTASGRHDYINNLVLGGIQQSCPPPMNFVATAVTDSSVTLDWTESGSATQWEVVYDLQGFDPNTGGITVPVSGSTGTSITGLTSGTKYDFYVRAICSASDLSTFNGPLTVAIPCLPATTPFYEGFETGYADQSDLGICWTQESLAGTSSWTVNSSLTSYDRSPRTGSYNVYLKYNNEDWMFYPISLTAGTNYQLEFYATQNASSGAEVMAAFGAANNDAAMTNVIVPTTQIVDGGYQRVSGYFSPATTGVFYIGIKGKLNITPWYLSIDDIGVTEVSCLEPNTLTASNITDNSIDLTWNEIGSATQWEVIYGNAGFDPLTTGTTVSVTGTASTTITGLNAGTEYDFYVRSDCGSGTFSLWHGPVSAITTCSSPLAGTYSVGTAGDYPNLSSAITALNSCGISAAVTFDVVAGSGPFDEQLILGEVTGASATNTITFNGNGETLTSATTSANRSLFLLDGADYITINNFNFVTQSDTYNFVIQLTNNADFNTITNNTVDLSSTLSSSSSSNAGIVLSGSLTSAISTGSNGSNITITNNTVIGGYYGITLNGESATNSTNNTVQDNTVRDFYTYGIYNKYVSNSSIEDNDVHRMNRVDTSTFNGIYFSSGGENNTINANRIHDSHTGGDSGSAYGIYFSSTDATMGNPNVISNNIIYNMNSESGLIYGIYNSGSDGAHYYFNSISLDDPNATGGNTRGFYQTTTATDIVFKNNIISITRGGSGDKYAMYFGTAGSSIESDYNIFYVNAAGNTGVGYLGGAQTTLADWQTASLGDANSMEADPAFPSPFAGDLTPVNASLDNLGTPIAGITTDINGNIRSTTTPDIGAFEFSPQSCPQPSTIAVSNISYNSADVSWNENGSAIEWEIEYGPAGFTHGTGTVIVDNDGTLGETISGLAGNTSYDIYVRAVCSTTDKSSWSGPISFRTLCSPFVAPYFDDVEAHMPTTNLVESLCWTADSDSSYDWNITDDGTTPSLNTGPLVANSGLQYFYVEATNGAVGDEARLVSPLIDISGITSPELTFYYHMYGAKIGTLNVDVFDGTTWNNSVASIVGPQQTSETDPWNLMTVDLSAYSGIIQIRFRAISAGTYEGDISLDDVGISGILPCADPSGITITNITDTTADVSWTENGTATEWEIEYGPAGFTQGTGTVVTDSDGTVGETLTGLSETTAYDVYVRAVCSTTSMSAWVGPESFTTLAPPCADPSGITITNITDTTADVSWTENGTATEWEIEYGPAGFTQGTGTVVTDSDGTVGETLTGLSETTAYDVYVRAVCSTTSMSAWVGPESFTTLAAPCVEPSGITITNITDTTADVSWTENGTATEWEIEYGPAGFTQGTGTVVTDSDGTVGETLTGLMPDTDYDVYVRAVCSTTSMSAWVGPESFTTTDLSVGDIDFNGFNFYPNPVISSLQLNASKKIDKVVIYNLLGQNVLETTPNSATTTLYVSQLQSGAYMMQVQIGKSTQVFKLIKR